MGDILAKIMKFEIYTKDKAIYEQIHELRFEMRKFLNRTIHFMYEWSNLTYIVKDSLDINLKPADILPNEKKGGGYKSADGFIYDQLSKTYTKNASTNRMTAIRKAVKLWNSSYKGILKGEKNIPFYKKSDKIYLYNKNIHLYTEDNKNYIDLTLFTRDYSKELGFESTKHLFNIIIGDNTQRTIFNRILSGEYTIGESQLTYDKKKKKFFIYLTYKFEKKIDTTRNNIMGVVLGRNFPVFIAINGSKARFKIEGGEVKELLKQIEQRRFSRRKQRLTAGDGSKKRGRDTFLKPITSLSNKYNNFSKLTNHNYSRFIINLAKKYNCGMIYMEDLTGNDAKEKFLGSWSYFDLQTKISYKADEIGILVEKRNNSFITQTCSSCGHVDENSIKKAMFICSSCGFESVIDYNSALNLANPEFDSLKTVKKAIRLKNKELKKAEEDNKEN